MNVLITGYKGFIGSNLIPVLKANNNIDNFLLFDKENSDEELKNMCKKCQVVFHLAAVVRPQDPKEYSVNTSLTSKLLDFLVESNNTCPIMFASSIQAELDNPYAECKRAEEETIFNYGKIYNVKTFVYRFPNLFGKFSRPNYTSVIATFCYNTSHNLPINISDPSHRISFSYVVDALNQVVKTVFSPNSKGNFKTIKITDYYDVSLGELAYYMGTLKVNKTPNIKREDDFYEKLKVVYEWFSISSYEPR